MSGRSQPGSPALLAQAWEHRLTLIVAPAGSGKSTLLDRFVADAPGPVAWYRADAWDRDPVRMLRRLEAALRAAVPALPTGWETMHDALDALSTTDLPPGLLLVVDDLHALAATDAERSLERLIERAPSGLTIVAATRAWPDMNLPRFKVAGELLEIGVDDLRFGHGGGSCPDVYGQPLPPEGWRRSHAPPREAAGLQCSISRPGQGAGRTPGAAGSPRQAHRD